MNKLLTTAALAAALSLTTAGNLLIADDADPDQEWVYGRELMTEQERNEHRNRMREAKTLEEREQVREEHHERMQQRAKELGLELPDKPMPGHGPMGHSPRGMGYGGGQR